MYHQPILIKEFLSFFSEQKIYRYIDGTIGSGGHAYAILEAHPEIEKLYGFDHDPYAIEIAAAKLEPFKKKVILIQANVKDFCKYISEPVEGIFLDLGVSSMQLDSPERGFSFYHEGPLDMRMNPQSNLDAKMVINTYSEKDLGRIFHEYGEEPRWRMAARAIVKARNKKPIKTTTDLVEVLKNTITRRKGKKIHPMTLVFQALRIYVNDELKGLTQVLPKGIESLVSKGRLGVLAFHSLEDRIVKHLFRDYALEKGMVKVLTKKPIVTGSEEIKNNPRSRSAKLRFIEKI
ncbi:MAG: 16S rRNA (cytosine(1402)-N(4))-methyltransferase RsmH [Chlamydiales bacterium]